METNKQNRHYSLSMCWWKLLTIFVFFCLIIGSSADGACHVDDLECFNEDRLGMEAIRSLHRQLDDDDNGNIDLSESDDVSITTGLKCIHYLPYNVKWLAVVCFLQYLDSESFREVKLCRNGSVNLWRETFFHNILLFCFLSVFVRF